MIVAGIGGATARELDTAWSPIVYPAQRLPLIFSHQAHLKRGATCATCHPAATTSRSAVDNPSRPKPPVARATRSIAPIPSVVAGAPVAACRACHLGYDPNIPIERVYITPPPLKFDHSAHAKQTCESCHGDMRAVNLATTRQLPTMAACLRCHTDGSEERHCADCHLAKLGGLIETSFEHGSLVPKHDGLGDAHGPDFARDHRQQARQVGATCTACHDRSECVDCHQGVIKPMEFHPGNYLLSHPVEARRGRPDCTACHRYETFCVACHERSGIGTRAGGQFNSLDPKRAFHPTGWSSAGPGPNLHAGEARRNIASCASCHRDEDCMDCHSAEPGKLHASPHPVGWRGSARCRALDRGNRRMCLRCHITQNELGCDWKSP